jgi:hypothetical protein
MRFRRIIDESPGPTVSAELNDGPMKGTRFDTEIVQGRPPATLDVDAADGTTCRYCLAEWGQSGPAAAYTFLYLV